MSYATFIDDSTEDFTEGDSYQVVDETSSKVKLVNDRGETVWVYKHQVQ